MKILVVDDSIVFRSAITEALRTVPDLNVFKSVVNGKLALDMLNLHPDIDLITLDMEMPVMDGLETIKEIRKTNKTVVIIVFSAISNRAAEKTVEALTAGANAFVTKSVATGSSEDSLERIKADLLSLILAFKEKLPKRASTVIDRKPLEVSTPKLAETEISVNYDLPIKPKLITIGISTGGPEALAKVFSSIKEKISIPILIVQHMPPVFTEKLASMLTKLSPVEVREARNGDVLTPGVCLLAPGDFHMVLQKNGTISLNQNEKVCFVRPAVNVLLNSVAENFDKKVLNIVMTGMGDDGAAGTQVLSAKGAYTYIQNKESSVVWGMPGAVFRTIGSQARIIPLNEIGNLITLASRRI